MSEQLLQVRNLSVSVEDKPILHGIDLEVRPGETHVLMGPNGQIHTGLHHHGKSPL